VAGSAVASVAFPTVVRGKATVDSGAHRAFVMPEVLPNYKLFSDARKGYAITVPRSFQEFDLSEKHLADIDTALRKNPNTPMAPAWRQIKDMVAHRGVVLFGTDDVSEDQIALAALPDATGPLPSGLEDGIAAEIESKGDGFLSGERTTVAGRTVVRVTARIGAHDGSADTLLVTQAYVSTGHQVWVLTIWFSHMDDPTLDPIIRSLRVA
jgi:hypothetical protein